LPLAIRVSADATLLADGLRREEFASERLKLSTI
jgi:hypothetical protein